MRFIGIVKKIKLPTFNCTSCGHSENVHSGVCLKSLSKWNTRIRNVSTTLNITSGALVSPKSLNQAQKMFPENLLKQHIG